MFPIGEKHVVAGQLLEIEVDWHRSACLNSQMKVFFKFSGLPIDVCSNEFKFSNFNGQRYVGYFSFSSTNSLLEVTFEKGKIAYLGDNRYSELPNIW